MSIIFHSQVDDPNVWREAFSLYAPKMQFYVWPDCDIPDSVELALVWHPPDGMLNNFRNLRLISSLGAGVDHLLNISDLPKGISITRIVEDSLTEQMVNYVVMATLYCHRGMPNYVLQQKDHIWKSENSTLSQDCSIGIMGLGVLGQAAASALRDLNFKIYGWSRTKKNISGISSYAGLNELNDFLKNVNILVCLLPLTNETENIINKDLLYNLPSGAYLINVGRGKHVIESDLINVLDSGHIEHAFLDVTREEPLPKNSKLWDHPKITLTPHVAAITNAASSSRQIIKNLDLVRSNLKPKNLVDIKVGY